MTLNKDCFFQKDEAAALLGKVVRSRWSDKRGWVSLLEVTHAKLRRYYLYVDYYDSEQTREAYSKDGFFREFLME